MTAQGPAFWSVVRVLLAAAQKRSAGRRKRLKQLRQKKNAANTTDWSGLGLVFSVLLVLVINALAAVVLWSAVEAAQRVEVERQGKTVVSPEFLKFASRANADDTVAQSYRDEAKHIAERDGGSPPVIERKLRDSVTQNGAADLVDESAASPGLKSLARSGPLAAMAGSIFLFWWAIMMTLQGEGVDLDIQRRRHPMWEWLLSHPVAPGAVFLAEMLSPMAANPMYWGGPLFAGFVYGFAYGPKMGAAATVLVGIPITVAAACAGKALEIGAMLRLAPRSRGATIGLMNWVGYTSMMLFLVGMYVVPRFITAMSGFLLLFAGIPWPWLNWFLGARVDGSFSFTAGVVSCWIAAAAVVTAAVWFSAWATEKGLSGSSAWDTSGTRATNSARRFGKEPLYRKEFLWFSRDRSAIVQAILIPLSFAAIQVFNLRGLLARAQSEWNYLCGVAIVFGTYFLWILGPKSLQSEGSALWIALTWPTGLESLLRAKARLWAFLSSGLVVLVLAYAALSYRAEAWKIALVGLGWFFFSRSMSEKSVTLVTITSSSGETEKVPAGRRWAAMLGMLTFGIGIVTAQWQLAIVGIVYSYLTAAAMWQNFRARLPFLYDPWSEKLPAPPTLMHAMISVSILVEIAAVLSGLFVSIAGRDNLAIAQAFGYLVSALFVSIATSSFLSKRGVEAQDVWSWKTGAAETEQPVSWIRKHGVGDPEALPALMMGAIAGIALGLLGRGYLAILHWLPATAELVRRSDEQSNGIPGFHLWYAVMAVGFAPFAEEYLFRGLLFRALDREWGRWRAVVGSAAFFAIYHPPLSWLPVGLLGAASALVFKKTGRLAPAVLLHMVYNAIVLL